MVPFVLLIEDTDVCLALYCFQLILPTVPSMLFIVDVDECTRGACNIPHVKTDSNGTNCVNKPGSFICLCQEGFKFNSVHCDGLYRDFTSKSK
jgi:Calcium-binding EGF domain